MHLPDLILWLDAHAHSIFLFMDYEVSRSSDAELAETLGADWLRKPETWNAPGYRFVSLGHDGTGGLVAAWFRPAHAGPPPIVFFGSEGGRGVLALTPERFAQALAHGPSIEEYPNIDSDEEEPSRLDPDNWMLDPTDADADIAQAAEAQATYQTAVVTRFGLVPELDQLVAGVDELNAEFRGWIKSVVSDSGGSE